MAITIIQTPNEVNLAQSPIIFAVSESNSNAFTSSSFQYLAELRYWTGSLTDSASVADYTLSKYPNASRTGIFDVSRIINSELSDIVQAVSSSVRYVAIDAYTQFLSGSTFVTGSHVVSDVYSAIDGYSLFQEPITQEIEQKTPFWPIMTQGPTSQSYQEGTGGRMSIWSGARDGGAPQVSALIYSTSLEGEDNNYEFPTGSNNSREQVHTFPISPSEPDWPLGTDLLNFEIFAISGSNNYNGSNRINERLHFDYVCDTKYDNIRIKWKNRFGQFDYYNFNLVSKESMSTQRQRYQPQIGSWNERGLSYEKFENSVQNYIVDSKQNLSVNSNYLPESYNDIFKELMVSDEVYWVQSYKTPPAAKDPGESLMPLAVQSSNFNIKTTKVDKLIQYQFDFIRGQGFKLII